MSGDPTYIELGVPDADAARAFYGALLGWRPSGDSGPGAVDTDTLGIGLHSDDDERHFQVFFAVDNIDVSRRRIAELGGKTIGDIHDEQGFGRWVECADDQGVRFGLRQQI
jgi:uncharacterized protein